MRSILILLLASLNTAPAFASDRDYYYMNRSELGSGDYLYRNQPLRRDPVFDQFRTVDLGINLGIGSDCGRVDFKNTLQATLKNILDSRYFGDMGKDIIAGSPMLLTCYFSPTWCAILKHSQINANFMSQMRLNQCALMDKYTDSRVADYYEERQTCVHKQIEQNGGNIEAAMQACNSSSMWTSDIANWSGSKYGEKSNSNELIGSSAKWAGFDQQEGGKDTINLVKSLVGDTVVARGTVSVNYGGKPFGITPRTHLAAIERDVQDKLCTNLLGKIDNASPGQSNTLIRTADLKSITGSDLPLLDQQTIRNLAVMPYKTRSLYCQRLANSIAASRFSEDMNRSLDVLAVASQNPNLPDRRRKEIADKRESLKQSIDATLELQRERNAPLNQIVAQINQEGTGLRATLSRERVERDQSALESNSARSKYFDCADGVFCGSKGGWE
ncbi:MAG: hypothetical protein AB7H97_16860 [Pseudobdellovibrionaceae bacterium]